MKPKCLRILQPILRISGYYQTYLWNSERKFGKSLWSKYGTIIVNVQCDNQDYTNVYMVTKQHGNPRCLLGFALGAKSGCKLQDQFFIFQFPKKLTSGILMIKFGILLWI